jgi:ribose-phosphate pyrophosphokinase
MLVDISPRTLKPSVSTKMAEPERRPILLALPESEWITARIADSTHAEIGAVTFHTFPDGESYVRVDSNVASRDVVIVASMHDPDAKLLSVLFLADALRDLGASSVGLVAPYLAYMRQDSRFRPGEAISSRTVASLVSSRVDWVVTVDPHLHRYASLSELYTIPAVALHAGAEIGHWISKAVRSPFIIGPDAESQQWVEEIAAAADAPFTVLTKTRRGDSDVLESTPVFSGHMSYTPVLVDDIISTGATMAAAVRHLRDQGSHHPICVATHAVFVGDAESQLRAAGAERVVTTNTILHQTNAIDVAGLIGATVRFASPLPV